MSDMMQQAFCWRTLESIVPAHRELAAKLREHLGPHPVPQSDRRTRGLMVEMSASEEHRDRLRSELPPLAAVLAAVGDRRPPTLVMAVNETPPGSADAFLMMPHVDRRYRAQGFSQSAPESTTVVMLDFPEDGIGGEMVVFDAGKLRENTPVSRLGARAAVEKAGGCLLPPVPGTAYDMVGGLPHAVLGYEAAPDCRWRLVVVIAEFAAVPTQAGPDATEWCCFES
jgi:hypothetical protein